MATRLYFHDELDNSSGLPTAEQSSLVADDNFEADQTKNRKINTIIGLAQVSLANASLATTAARNYYAARFVSKPLDVNQTISANTWIFNFAANESNANANFPVSGTNQVLRVNAYVWRPSTQTKVGTILDGNSAAAYDEPSATSTEKVMHGTFAGAAVTALAGDVIIFEIWAVVTQGMGVSYTQTIYFDGTTENTTENATVSNHASFLETPQNITFESAAVITRSFATVQ